MAKKEIIDKLKEKKEKGENAINKSNNNRKKKSKYEGKNNGVIKINPNNFKVVERSHYIYSYQDEKLDYLKKKTGESKTELVRIALDYFIDNVEIDSKINRKKKSKYESKNNGVIKINHQNYKVVERSHYIYSYQNKRLEYLKKKTGKSKTELVRIALDNFINNIEI
ncbi:MAG: hypothetical protein ACOCP8_09605 [archaeon]